MKKIGIVVFMMLGLVQVQGQVGFTKIFDDAIGGTDFLGVEIDSDTIVMYGLGYDTLTHTLGIRFIKLDTFGHVLLEQFVYDTSKILTTWSGARDVMVKSIDGGYVMVGNTLSTGELYMIKLNHDFTLEFLKIISMDILTSGFSIVEVPTGYLILGTDQHPDLIVDPVVMKVDKQGNLLWRKDYGTELWEGVGRIIQLSANEFVCIGGASDFDGYIAPNPVTYNKGLAFHIDSMGNELTYWHSSDELGSIRNIAVLPDSSWICIGSTVVFDSLHGDYDYHALAYNISKQKNLVWRKEIGEVEEYILFDIITAQDKDYVIGGVHKDGLDDVFHMKLSSDGDSIWMRRDSINLNSGLFEPSITLTSMDVLSTGSIISIGFTQRKSNTGTVGTYGFVMKLSPDGCLDTIGCWPVADYFPDKLVELSLYPNPFTDYLVISLHDYYPHNAYIYFYDVMGRFLHKERVRHGANELDVIDFPKGMVFYEVRDGGVVIGRGKVVKE